MESYTPPCEIYADEDLDFTGRIVEVDDESWDICYDIEANDRCYDCFLKEQCVSAAMEALANSYWVDSDRVVEEKDVTYN